MSKISAGALALLTAMMVLTLGSGVAKANNIYIAQSALGANNGQDCADAYAVTFFNAASNWGSGGNQIGPGTTVNLCGIISTELTVQGSGSNSSPITILWQPEAMISLPACDNTNGCINVSGHSWIVLNGNHTSPSIQNTGNGNLPFSLTSISCNGTTCTATCPNGTPGSASAPQCGFFQPSDGVPTAYYTVTISGTSQPTLNTTVLLTSYTGCTTGTGCAPTFTFAAPGGFSGSASGGQAGVLCPSSRYCTTAQNVVGVNAIGSTSCSNCAFENMTISNLFWEWSPTVASQVNFGVTAAFFIDGPPAGNFININNNICHDVRACVSYTPAYNNDNALLASNGGGIYNNYFYDADGINIEGNTVALIGATIHDNHFGATINWDSSRTWPSTSGGCDYHHDGIHMWGLGGTNSNIAYYNNLHDGAWGQCPTGAMFFEADNANGTTSNNHCQVFNNIYLITYSQDQNGIVNIGCNDLQFYNNTIIGANSSDICFVSQGGGVAGHTVKYENNLVTQCKTLLLTQDSPIYTMWDYNIYAGCQPSGCNWNTPFVVNNSAFDTFQAWQTACSCDFHSAFVPATSYPMINPSGVPQSGSPTITAGANLTVLAIAPLNSSTSAGNTVVPTQRASGTCTNLGANGCWTLGAYNYGDSPPSPPTQVTAVVH